MSDMDNQTELEALQTLLTRGVITQEQFNQLSAGVTSNTANAVPPLPPPVQSKSWGKKKIAVVSMMVVVLVAIGAGLAIKQQQDSQRQEAKKNAQEERELGAIKEKACDDFFSVSKAWSDYVDVLNENKPSSASSLSQAKQWSIDKGDATSIFRRILKKVDHPDVSPHRDKLLRQVNLVEDAYTLMGGADTRSEFNSLITSTNLLGNDLNEYKDDLFAAITKACSGNTTLAP